MKFFVSESFSPESLSILKSNSKVSLLEEANKFEAEVLLIRSHTKVSQNFLKDYKDLKLIVTATSGFDHIHLDACSERGVKVSFCPEANAQSTAEHTLFLMLSLLRGARQQDRSLRGGDWKSNLTRGRLLHHKIIGVVGLGRVGQRVAKLCQAFGAKVVAHDPYQDDGVFDSLRVERKGFTEVLKESDILTFHVPLTSETHHMINGSTISEMSDETYLINASRGDVVEESDLSMALKQGHLAGAALDVFKKEPMESKSFLLKEPKLFLTPHTGAYTLEAWEAASMEAVQKAILFAEGQDIGNLLPLTTPWFKKSLFPT